MMFSGRHFSLSEFVRPPYREWDPEVYETFERSAIEGKRLRRYLGTCPQGMFVTTHARFHPILQEIVEEIGFRHILLLRDPRDVAVSYTMFVTREAWHHHHRYYAEGLETDQERLMATITGFDGSPLAPMPLAPIGNRVAGFLPWLTRPSVLVSRFEDLVAPGDNGSPDRRTAEVMRIAEFVDRPLTEELATRVARKMYSSASLTFRKGVVGDWREHFNDEHRRAFKAQAGSLLITLGYEDDHDW
jgi:hypothetical protein